MVSLSLELGPSFVENSFTIETTDHATLNLDLSFNWEFMFDRNNPEHIKKIFSNKDYIGNACKALSSRIRGNVSTETFDYFHKNSHMLIKGALLKKDKETGEVRPFIMKENFLAITEINSKGYKPTDITIEDLLQRSFKISLDIQNESKEAEARFEQDKLEQEAQGQLEIQRIQDQLNSEMARKTLLESQAETATLQKQGQAIANARAIAEAKKIEGTSLVSQAENKVKAVTNQRKVELDLQRQRMLQELS